MRRALLPLSSAILAALGSAAGSGLLASDAAAQVATRRRDEDAPPPLLVVPSHAAPPILIAGHRSHSSHSSHRSHSSHYSSSGGGSWSTPSQGTREPVMPDPPPPPPPPPKPKPGHVVIIAYPGGKIFVDDRLLGHDATQTVALTVGSHEVRIVNRFLGEFTTTIEISDGQTGAIPIHW